MRISEFQCDRTAKIEVLGLVHDTHATPAKLLDNAVVGDGLPE